MAARERYGPDMVEFQRTNALLDKSPHPVMFTHGIQKSEVRYGRHASFTTGRPPEPSPGPVCTKPRPCHAWLYHRGGFKLLVGKSSSGRRSDCGRLNVADSSDIEKTSNPSGETWITCEKRKNTGVNYRCVNTAGVLMDSPQVKHLRPGSGRAGDISQQGSHSTQILQRVASIPFAQPGPVLCRAALCGCESEIKNNGDGRQLRDGVSGPGDDATWQARVLRTSGAQHGVRTGPTRAGRWALQVCSCVYLLPEVDRQDRIHPASLRATNNVALCFPPSYTSYTCHVRSNPETSWSLVWGCLDAKTVSPPDGKHRRVCEAARFVQICGPVPRDLSGCVGLCYPSASSRSNSAEEQLRAETTLARLRWTLMKLFSALSSDKKFAETKRRETSNTPLVMPEAGVPSHAAPPLTQNSRLSPAELRFTVPFQLHPLIGRPSHCGARRRVPLACTGEVCIVSVPRPGRARLG
ncbi:hypothetical protein Bbelb_337340 [Branchiostoma belcheri]|nr:hypothetical protein Bbelb_337340 [Branchiostoma belcheri]